jgi:hypothetical protein
MLLRVLRAQRGSNDLSKSMKGSPTTRRATPRQMTHSRVAVNVYSTIADVSEAATEAA